METNDILGTEEIIEADEEIEASEIDEFFEADETDEADEVIEPADSVDEAETPDEADAIDVVEADETDAAHTGTKGSAEPVASDEELNEFQKVRARLEEIASLVDSDEISLDEALDLYEEAVVLGLQATDMLDVGITAQEEAQARMLGETAGNAAEGSDVGIDDAPYVVPSLEQNSAISQPSETNDLKEEQDATTTDTEHVG